MTVQTARDILDEARYFHHQLKAFYDGLHDKVESPHVQLILEYLSRHEERLEDTLENYEESVAKKIADTWFKYTPAIRIDEVIAEIPVKPSMTLDELMTIALQLENCFISLYRHIADQAVSDEVRDVFEKLEKQSIKDRTNLARDLVDMQDI